ncbi:CAP-associated domain-containing protein [Alkalihalobacillus oceani]|uniref:CAP-associated domain-containing protein n=1 Tax=Halalkalibacter oceani TaxID=1653776 RepID=A0A9X2DUQ3_9BACI|nr:stalk domain-containing protein [Halalkalibacter oceani]MCM3716430.1 CAP-associated domain-containing protein [Halalkalibacter oceani]
MKWWNVGVGAMILWLGLLATQTVAAAEQQISVYINEHPLELEHEAVMKDGVTFVPLRDVMRELDAELSWEAETDTVFIKKNGQTIEVPVGKSYAVVNGKKQFLHAPSFLTDQTAYVPVRFASDILGAKVKWEKEKQAVFLSTAERLTFVAEQTIAPEPRVASLWLGDSLESVQEQLGEPLSTVASAYSFDWNIYQLADSSYLHVGLEEGSVVAFYTNTSRHVTGLPFIDGMRREQMLADFGEERLGELEKKGSVFRYEGKKEWDLFQTDDAFYTLFYDQLKGGAVTAVQIIAKDVELAHDSYFGEPTEERRADYEKHLFYLLQGVRQREGVPPLMWDDEAAQLARKHSEDMQENQFFSHTNLDGLSPFDRFDREGIAFYQAGENLAVGQFHPIFAHEALMNSAGHRRNMLAPGFERVGTGVAFLGEKPYYTINFYTPL